MNARLYGPILGRFLSPAPYVQLPDFTQAMNRYGYCMNRPLCYVDKNGEIIGWIIAGAIIGGTIGGGTAIAKEQNFWHGNAIAQGRGVFSWKNTPVGEYREKPDQ